MPFDPNLIRELYLIDALKNSSPSKVPQSKPDSAQPVPEQPQAPSMAPSMPQNLGQATNQGGGFAQTLGNMGKSFLNTAAEAIPPALANRVLFGNTQFANQMTYASMVDQLEEKKAATERKRIDKVSGISTFLYSMQNYGKQFNVKPEDIEMALMTGSKTGVTDIDNQIGQAHESLKPMIESGEINAGDILEGMKKRAEYVKLLEGDIMSPAKEAQEIRIAVAKQKPSKIDKYSPEGMVAEKELIAAREKEEAKNRRPEKPDRPLAKQRVMMTSPDGTMEVDAIFNPDTGITSPIKGKPWRKKESKKSGSPKNAEEFLSKFK